MISKDDFKVTEFRDGEVCLDCGKGGAERDLVFAIGSYERRSRPRKTDRRY